MADRETARSGEGAAALAVRRVGVWILLLALFLPSHGCEAHPSQYDDDPSVWQSGPRHRDSFPVGRIEWLLREKVFGEDLKEVDRFFPDGGHPYNTGWTVFLALPVWAAALLLAGGSPRRRALAGKGLRIVSIGLVVVLGFGVHEGVGAIASNPKGYPAVVALTGGPWLQKLFVFTAGLLLLAARPRGRWSADDPEAWLSTQAQLGIGVLLFRPVWEAADWILEDGYPLDAVLITQWINYKVGTWVTLLGLLLLALPLYFSVGSLRDLYDRPLPWPFRSSTRTRTSTSTGSTGTGTRSSTGPGPPGSSPS